jgi:hypothetical protein
MTRAHGWAFFCAEMDRQIEERRVSPDTYREHLERQRQTKSWRYYLDWLERHPGQVAPDHVARIRTDEEFDAWAAAGFPPLQRRASAAAPASVDEYERRLAAAAPRRESEPAPPAAAPVHNRFAGARR